LNNSIIPYNTWWGIIIWAVLFGLTILSFFIIYKKGDRIEKYIKTKISRKDKHK
jgi:hypothetical protein